MKKLFIASLILALPLMANADSEAIRTVKALGLHEYICVLETRTQEGKNSRDFGLSINVVALNETEALKICLNQVHTMSVGRGTELMALKTSISKEAVFINKIEIRTGQF